MNRFVILAEGQLGIFSAKTATSVMRYRPHEVVAVLDSRFAGQTARELLGVPCDAPVVASLEAALPLQPTALLIGIAPAGGQLPPQWRGTMQAALQAGLDVVSGLHVFLADDPELAALAREQGREIIDLRRPPEGQPIARGRARTTRARRILTIGSDCNVGKMVTALEVTDAAQAAGRTARFIATGQTGMLIAGNGLTIDRVPGDFMAGFVEEIVVRAGDAEAVVVEGQGSLIHPAYSGVTAALLHGALPDAMILCHVPGRRVLRNQEALIPPLTELIALYEAFLRPLHPGRVVAVALNGAGLEEAEIAAAVRAAEAETGLPAADPIRHGAVRLWEACVEHEAAVKR
jgi:D-glutamate N-acetyltransferase